MYSLLHFYIFEKYGNGIKKMARIFKCFMFGKYSACVGKAKGCCMHVFLVLFCQISIYSSFCRQKLLLLDRGQILYRKIPPAAAANQIAEKAGKARSRMKKK